MMEAVMMDDSLCESLNLPNLKVAGSEYGTVLALKLEVQEEGDQVEVPKPLLFRHVLKNMFSYLDSGSLKKCRLVCKTWTEPATPELAKKSRIRVGPHHWDVDPCPIEEDRGRKRRMHEYAWEKKKAKGFERFQSLSEMLQGCPRGLFKNVKIHYSWLFTEEIKAWVVEAGKDFKSLKIMAEHSGMDATILTQLLTEWCPNLEVLSMFVPYGIFSGCFCCGPFIKPVFLDISAEFPKSLNLKSVHLNGSSLKQLPNFSLSLVKASPNLEKICTNFSHRMGKDDSERDKFYTELAKHPEITTNLTELRFDEWEMEEKTLAIFEDLKFSKKFHTLGLGKYGYDLKKHDLKKDKLIQVIAKTVDYLETLILQGDFDEFADSTGNSGNSPDEERVLSWRRTNTNWATFPRMERLTRLVIKRFKEIRPQDLSAFPNLKILELGCNCSWERTRGFIDTMFDGYDDLKDHPGLPDLKVLKLKQQIKRVSTLQSIALCFPEVSELWITTQKTDLSTAEVLQAAALTTFASIKKLKIYFKKFSRWDDEIREAISCMKLFPELEELTLFVADGEVLKTDDLELAFEAPKLTSFTLGHYYLQNTKLDIWDFMKELKMPKERKIYLGSVNYGVFACCEGLGDNYEFEDYMDDDANDEPEEEESSKLKDNTDTSTNSNDQPQPSTSKFIAMKPAKLAFTPTAPVTRSRTKPRRSARSKK